MRVRVDSNRKPIPSSRPVPHDSPVPSPSPILRDAPSSSPPSHPLRHPPPHSLHSLPKPSTRLPIHSSSQSLPIPPVAPPVSRPPASSSSHLPNPLPTPSHPVQTPVEEEPAPSDTASSASTNEAYNSEDEHPGPDRPEIPVRTLREREREFSDLLHAKGLRIVDMRPDGNCLFRALAHVVWMDAERHPTLRARVMHMLVQERDYFSQFVAEDFARYVRRKSRDGVHGNHLELQAAAELFGRAIEVYSYADTPATVVDATWAPAANGDGLPDPIRLSFHRGCHYNAVVPSTAATKSVPGKKAAAAAAVAAAAATAATAASTGRLEEGAVDPDWRVAAEVATEDEVERAVMALSLVEATRGESGAAGSSSSSSTMIPSGVLALVNSGYTEEQANEAYQVAGHGGLAEMVRYLRAQSYPNSSVSGGEASASYRGKTPGWRDGAGASASPSRASQQE